MHGVLSQRVSSQMTDPIGVLIVEPSEGRRVRLLKSLERDGEIEVVGMGKNLLDACQVNCPPRRVDVLLSNCCLVTGQSVHAWAIVHTLLPGARVVLLFDEVDEQTLVLAVAAGVIVLHRSNADSMVLAKAIRRAADGVPDLDRGIALRLRHAITALSLGSASFLGARNPSLRSSWSTPSLLTHRERQVLELLALAMRDREIAAHVHLSEKTIRNIVSTILSKLGVDNRTHAALWAKEHDL